MRATQPQRFCGLSSFFASPTFYYPLLTSFQRRYPLVQITSRGLFQFVSPFHTVILFSYCFTWLWQQTLPQQTISPSSTIPSLALPHPQPPSSPFLQITMHQPLHLPARPDREPDQRPNAAYDSNHHPPIHPAVLLTTTASFPRTRLAK